MLRRFITFSFLRQQIDVARLFLHIGIGFDIFVKRGWEKTIFYNFMDHRFFDPLNVGAHLVPVEAAVMKTIRGR